MRSDPGARAGMTLLELLVVMSIAALLLAVLLGLLLAQVRIARVAAERVLTADAIRTTLAVLGGETQRAAPADVRGFSADSLAIRTFRGTAVVCGADAARLVTRFRGDRLPDERKDSLLVISADGTMTVAAVLGARPVGDCAPGPGEISLELRTLPHVRHAAVALLFESGTYYLSARALRYRLGAEGRQPLTAEAFRDATTSFTASGAAGIRFRLTPLRGSTSYLSAAYPAVTPP